jgi:hypothetical protein
MSTNPTKNTRARITQRDAIYLAFLAKFPAADAEALSYLAYRGDNPWVGGDELPTPSGITRKMTKLTQLGAVSRYRNPLSGVSHYGLTPLGHEAVTFYGYDIPTWRGIKGLSISRLEHYRNIALVAAQLVSPTAPLASELRLPGALPLELLVSENEMRSAYDTIARQLASLREEGKAGATYAAYRYRTAEKLLAEADAGDVEHAEIVARHPELLTIATPATKNPDTHKPIHQNDLAIRLDDMARSAKQPRTTNILVEVEIAMKKPEAYEQVMRTLRAEFSAGIAYQRAVYFCGTPAIAKRVRDADRNAGTGLIDKRRLLVLPITGRTPHPARQTERVTVPQEPAATVTTSEEETR